MNGWEMNLTHLHTRVSHQAVGWFGSSAASSTMFIAAVHRFESLTPARALLRTDHLSHWIQREKEL